MSTMEENLLYMPQLVVHRGDLDIEKSCLSGDLEASELINGELSDPMSSYYGKVRGNDKLVRE